MAQKQKPGLILDLDGTLYRLRSPDGTFARSDFSAALGLNAVAFLGQRLQISEPEALLLLGEARSRGTASLVFERYHGIDRYEWFANVWNLDPAQFVTPATPDSYERLRPCTGRSVLLTSGPRIWAEATLRHLGIADIFEGRLITGEPDERKPELAVFKQAAALLARPPEAIVSIGDQYRTDIVPARQLGMHTIIIGPQQAGADHRADDIGGALDIMERLDWL